MQKTGRGCCVLLLIHIHISKLWPWQNDQQRHVQKWLDTESYSAHQDRCDTFIPKKACAKLSLVQIPETSCVWFASCGMHFSESKISFTSCMAFLKNHRKQSVQKNGGAQTIFLIINNQSTPKIAMWLLKNWLAPNVIIILSRNRFAHPKKIKENQKLWCSLHLKNQIILVHFGICWYILVFYVFCWSKTLQLFFKHLHFQCIRHGRTVVFSCRAGVEPSYPIDKQVRRATKKSDGEPANVAFFNTGATGLQLPTDIQSFQEPHRNRLCEISSCFFSGRGLFFGIKQKHSGT